MSDLAESPGPGNSQRRWIPQFARAAGFGAGFAIMLASIAGATMWYLNRPKPPKPWNASAITAEYDSLDVEGNENNLRFEYVLQNNTDFDYRLNDESSHSLVSKLKRQNSLSLVGHDRLVLDYPLFVPAHKRAWVLIHLKEYPYKEREKPNMTDDEKHDFMTRIAQFVDKDLGNLDGFVLLDEGQRYEIAFPPGWRERAKEQMRVGSSNKK